jgi:integration host factor subunit alpha
MTTKTPTTTISRSELCRAVAADLGLPAGQVERTVAAFERHIAGALALGQDVTLLNFGRFAHELRGPTKGRNPRTGEAIEIGERHQVKFRASPQLVRAIALHSGGGGRRQLQAAAAPAAA